MRESTLRAEVKEPEEASESEGDFEVAAIWEARESRRRVVVLDASLFSFSCLEMFIFSRASSAGFGPDFDRMRASEAGFFGGEGGDGLG